MFFLLYNGNTSKLELKTLKFLEVCGYRSIFSIFLNFLYSYI